MAVRQPTRKSSIPQPETAEDTTPVSKEDYERYLHRRWHTGNHFTFHRDFLAVMSVEAAVVVQSLANLGRGLSKDGWVLCTRQFLLDTLRMNRRSQDRALRELYDLGYIQIRSTGMPRRRSIRVLVTRIEKAIDHCFGEEHPAEDPPSQSVQNRTDQSEHTSCHIKNKCKYNSPIHHPYRDECMGEAGVATQRPEPPISPQDAPGRANTPRDARNPARKPSSPRAKRGAVSRQSKSQPRTKEQPITADGVPPVQPDTTPSPAERVVPPNCTENGQESVTALKSSVDNSRKSDSDQDPPYFGDNTSTTPEQDMDPLPFPPSKKDKRPKVVIDPGAPRCVKLLRDYAKEHGWYPSKGRSNWEEPFSVLIRQHGFDVVWGRLSAYVAQGITKPTICNGDEFRHHWDWIGQAVARGERHPPAPEPGDMHPDAVRVLSRLSGIGGLTTTREAELRGVVNQSVLNFVSYADRVQPVLWKPPSEADGVTAAVVRRVQSAMWNWDAEDYITQWMKARVGVQNWDKWNGSMGSFLWRPDHDKFRAEFLLAVGSDVPPWVTRQMFGVVEAVKGGRA